MGSKLNTEMQRFATEKTYIHKAAKKERGKTFKDKRVVKR